MANTTHFTILGAGPAGLAAGGAVRRLPNAYPVLESGIGDAMAEIGRYLAGFGNLRMVGRGGTFTYEWIHNMIRDGRLAVAEIAAGR